MSWINENEYYNTDPAGGNENPLISAADLAEWLNIASPTTNQAARLQTATQVATGYVTAVIGRPAFPVDDESATINGTGRRSFQLPINPVRDLTSVTEDGVLVSASAYTWSESGKVLRTDGLCWTWAQRGIVVVYSHGWLVLPQIITSVCLACASRVYQNPSGQVLEESLGDHSIKYAAATLGLLPEESAALMAEKDWLVG